MGLLRSFPGEPLRNGQNYESARLPAYSRYPMPRIPSPEPWIASDSQRFAPMPMTSSRQQVRGRCTLAEIPGVGTSDLAQPCLIESSPHSHAHSPSSTNFQIPSQRRRNCMFTPRKAQGTFATGNIALRAEARAIGARRLRGNTGDAPPIWPADLRLYADSELGLLGSRGPRYRRCDRPGPK